MFPIIPTKYVDSDTNSARPADRRMSRTQFYDEYDVDFRIATPGAAICCEAARSGPRLLHPAAPDPETLRAEFKPPLHKRPGQDQSGGG